MSDLKLKDRNGIWYAVGSIGGRRVRRSLETSDETKAREALAHLASREWKRSQYGEEAVRLFEEAAVSYLKQGGEGRYLAPIIRHFKGRKIGTIKPAELRDMALTLYPNHKASTRNRQAIIPARAVILHAHDRGWCGAIKVKQFEVAKPNKHKPVNRDWLNAFLAQADKDGLPHLAACVLFMHQTAARVTEAINVTGDQINLSQKTVMLAKTKTDEWVERALTNELVVRLATLGLKDGERAFSYTDRSAVNRRIKSVCKRAKIASSSTHSAGRHSFGTNAMAVENANIKDAMDAGGWKSAKLFLETYVHSDAAGKKLADKFDKASGTPENLGTIESQPVKRKRYRFGKAA